VPCAGAAAWSASQAEARARRVARRRENATSFRGDVTPGKIRFAFVRAEYANEGRGSSASGRR